MGLGSKVNDRMGNQNTELVGQKPIKVSGRRKKTRVVRILCRSNIQDEEGNVVVRRHSSLWLHVRDMLA